MLPLLLLPPPPPPPPPLITKLKPKTKLTPIQKPESTVKFPTKVTKMSRKTKMKAMFLARKRKVWISIY